MAQATLNVPYRFWSQKLSTLPVIVILLVSEFSPAECKKCSLPDSWNGRWFIDEFAHERHTEINSSSNFISRAVNPLGECIWSWGADIFIFQNPTKPSCRRCVLMAELYISNILFSREVEDCKDESEWDQDDLKELCDQLHDSGVLHWFKVDYKPAICPFGDMSFPFAYKKYDEKCESPVSHSSACMDNTKMELHYEACHNDMSTEGKIEQLTCLGGWTDSGYYYFVADVLPLNHRGELSLRDRYRCYVVKNITRPNPVPFKPNIVEGYEIGTSETPTCTALLNPEGAALTLYLKKELVYESEIKPCSFPEWLVSHHWMDMNTTVEFRVEDSKVNVELTRHSQVTHPSSRRKSFFPLSLSSLECKRKVNISEGDDSHVAIVGRYKVGCKIDEICVHLVKRAMYIFQIYYMERAKMSSESLRTKCFNATIGELRKGVTMISTKGEKQTCLIRGNYAVESAQIVSDESKLSMSPYQSSLDRDSLNEIFTSPDGNWSIGCTSSDQIEVLPSENSVKSESFSCNASWKDKEANYTVLEWLTSKKRMADESDNISVPSKLFCLISQRLRNDSGGAETIQTFVSTQDCISFYQTVTPKEEDSDSEDEKSADPNLYNNYQVGLVRRASCGLTSESEATDDGLKMDEQIDNDSHENATVSSASSLSIKGNWIPFFALLLIFVINHL